MPKFERAQVGASRTLDETSRIRIYVSRCDAATAGKENITRSIVVESAKVSEVVDAINAALFTESAEPAKPAKKAA
jgi:hypothetical protein